MTCTCARFTVISPFADHLQKSSSYLWIWHAVQWPSWTLSSIRIHLEPQVCRSGASLMIQTTWPSICMRRHAVHNWIISKTGSTPAHHHFLWCLLPCSHSAMFGILYSVHNLGQLPRGWQGSCSIPGLQNWGIHMIYDPFDGEQECEMDMRSAQAGVSWVKLGVLMDGIQKMMELSKHALCPYIQLTSRIVNKALCVKKSH